MPEFIHLVFAETSPKRSFSLTENERFGLVFAKTGSVNSGTRKDGMVKPKSYATVDFGFTIPSFLGGFTKCKDFFPPEKSHATVRCDVMIRYFS